MSGGAPAGLTTAIFQLPVGWLAVTHAKRRGRRGVDSAELPIYRIRHLKLLAYTCSCQVTCYQLLTVRSAAARATHRAAPSTPKRHAAGDQERKQCHTPGTTDILQRIRTYLWGRHSVSRVQCCGIRAYVVALSAVVPVVVLAVPSEP